MASVNRITVFPATYKFIHIRNEPSWLHSQATERYCTLADAHNRVTRYSRSDGFVKLDKLLMSCSDSTAGRVRRQTSKTCLQPLTHTLNHGHNQTHVNTTAPLQLHTADHEPKMSTYSETDGLKYCIVPLNTK